MVTTPILVIVAFVAMTNGFSRERWDIILLGGLALVLAAWAFNGALRQWKKHRQASSDSSSPDS